MWVFLDLFFVVFHATLILFVLAGWAWRPLRRLHLLVTASVLISWFGLGVLYGVGYCPSTDWHWRVKQELGQTNLPRSWVKYYLDRTTPWDWDPFAVDLLVVAIGLAAFAAAVWSNRDLRPGRKPPV